MSTIRYISLFSGIEAATVAWHQLGWKPIAYAEIEPFPKAWRGREHAPDGPRYKALGNSMAVPVMRWIGEGIQLVEDNKELFEKDAQ